MWFFIFPLLFFFQNENITAGKFLAQDSGRISWTIILAADDIYLWALGMVDWRNGLGPVEDRESVRSKLVMIFQVLGDKRGRDMWLLTFGSQYLTFLLLKDSYWEAFTCLSSQTKAGFFSSTGYEETHRFNKSLENQSQKADRNKGKNKMTGDGPGHVPDYSTVLQPCGQFLNLLCIFLLPLQDSKSWVSTF